MLIVMCSIFLFLVKGKAFFNTNSNTSWEMGYECWYYEQLQIRFGKKDTYFDIWCLVKLLEINDWKYVSSLK